MQKNIFVCDKWGEPICSFKILLWNFRSMKTVDREKECKIKLKERKKKERKEEEGREKINDNKQTNNRKSHAL